jgi:hypothetical protein
VRRRCAYYAWRLDAALCDYALFIILFSRNLLVMLLLMVPFVIGEFIVWLLRIVGGSNGDRQA